MMWSDSAGFSVSSNLCWAWGCQRVGECLCIDEWAEWERGSHAAVTGRHSASSLWQVYIPQRTSYKAAHRSESTTIYICVAFQSFNVKIHSPDLMVRATSNCAFTFFFSLLFLHHCLWNKRVGAYCVIPPPAWPGSLLLTNRDFWCSFK